MKYIFAAVAMMGLAVSAGAADKPNFSGNWKMNVSKSDYGQFPPPDSFIRTIKHSEPSISIYEEQKGPNTQPPSTREMTTDGKEASSNINGADVKLTATWEGTALTAKTVIDNFGVAFIDKMTLSADGKELTSMVQIESAQGNAAIKVVFDKQ